MLIVIFLCIIQTKFFSLFSRPKSSKAQKIVTRPSDPSVQFLETAASPSPITRSISLTASCHQDRLQAADSILQFNFRHERVRTLSKVRSVASNSAGIIYWMSRDGNKIQNTDGLEDIHFFWFFK
jgi:hypothetical protein